MSPQVITCPSMAGIYAPRIIPATADWRQPGFTLTEMLVVVAIIAILAVVAIPSFNDYFEKARVKRAAENIHGLILQAKAEGPIRDRNISLSVNPDSWCLGFATTPGCDCTAISGNNACAIDVAGVSVRQVLNGDDFPGVTITHTFPQNRSTFNRLRKTASPAGTIQVQAGQWTLDVRLGVSGRVRICAPDGSASAGYPAC